MEDRDYRKISATMANKTRIKLYGRYVITGDQGEMNARVVKKNNNDNRK